MISAADIAGPACGWHETDPLSATHMSPVTSHSRRQCGPPMRTPVPSSRRITVGTWIIWRTRSVFASTRRRMLANWRLIHTQPCHEKGGVVTVRRPNGRALGRRASRAGAPGWRARARGCASPRRRHPSVGRFRPPAACGHGSANRSWSVRRSCGARLPRVLVVAEQPVGGHDGDAHEDGVGHLRDEEAARLWLVAYLVRLLGERQLHLPAGVLCSPRDDAIIKLLEHTRGARMRLPDDQRLELPRVTRVTSLMISGRPSVSIGSKNLNEGGACLRMPRRYCPSLSTSESFLFVADGSL